jgi:hypothetical protein
LCSPSFGAKPIIIMLTLSHCLPQAMSLQSGRASAGSCSGARCLQAVGCWQAVPAQCCMPAHMLCNSIKVLLLGKQHAARSVRAN